MLGAQRASESSSILYDPSYPPFLIRRLRLTWLPLHTLSSPKLDHEGNLHLILTARSTKQDVGGPTLEASGASSSLRQPKLSVTKGVQKPAS